MQSFVTPSCVTSFALAAVSVLSAQAGLVSFNVAMSGRFGGALGTFNDTTHAGNISGLVYLTRSQAAKADIVDCTTGTHVTDLSLTVIPVGRGSLNLFFSGSITLSDGEFNRFCHSQLCVQLINGEGGVVSRGTIVPSTVCPEPEVYAGAASLALAGFALWRRRAA